MQDADQSPSNITKKPAPAHSIIRLLKSKDTWLKASYQKQHNLKGNKFSYSKSWQPGVTVRFKRNKGKFCIWEKLFLKKTFSNRENLIELSDDRSIL